MINVYPNPGRDVLNVEIRNANAAKMNMVITDAYEKIVINKAVEFINVKGMNRMQLAISKLPAGTYNLKLLCSEGCEKAGIKFVKQ
jgi:hypothetical protein